jgi:hypothetical protein
LDIDEGREEGGGKREEGRGGREEGGGGKTKLRIEN